MKRCPICDKPETARYRPFCSRRCADVDLGRWLDGVYRLPAVEPPDEFEDERPPEENGDGNLRH